MQFDSLTEFLNMGGHGIYVWLAYGATLLTLMVSYVSVTRASARMRRELRISARSEQNESITREDTNRL